MSKVIDGILAGNFEAFVIICRTLLEYGVVFFFSLSGWACRYDASSIGRVISVERVRYGNFIFSTGTCSLFSESHFNVVEL